MGAICDPAAWTSSAIGEMPGSIEIKLVDCPDLKYFSSHSPTPQGEIWIRGAAVADGYLDLEEETKEAFTADGWFKTGDIGEFNEDGLLRVIDRKKNMVKTLNGEYIALEKVRFLILYSMVLGIANVPGTDTVGIHLPLLQPRRQYLRLCRRGQTETHCYRRTR